MRLSCNFMLIVILSGWIILISGSCKKSEKTNNPPRLFPVLTTNPVHDITYQSATCGGLITNDYGDPVTSRGVCWSTGENPTIADNKTVDGSGTGSFASNIVGLTPGTKYSVRAYATNSIGTGYGNILSFSASSQSLPIVTIDSVSLISFYSAVCVCSIANTGGALLSSSGVCWSTIQHPTISDNKTTNGPKTGSFPDTITGLKQNTKYYVRGYGTNAIGTGYGNEVTFTTAGILPDDIHYVDFDPDTTFTSVSYWTIDEGFGIPSPYDSSSGMIIDLDQDNIGDLHVIIRHDYMPVEPSEPWSCYQYHVYLWMVDQNDNIAYNKIFQVIEYCDVAIPFKKDSLISDTLSYNESATAYKWCIGPYCDCYNDSYSGDGYFGFRLKRNGGYNYGWILLNLDQLHYILTIKEFAINRTKNNSIKAGQKQ